jgi:hypothetical protein
MLLTETSYRAKQPVSMCKVEEVHGGGGEREIHASHGSSQNVKP